MIAQLDREYLRAGPGRVLTRLVSYGMFEGRPLTTRGRWINPLVFGFLRTLRRVRARSPHRPVFIVGMGRTGTTILGKVLSLHPDVGFLNEPKAVWHLIHPAEDLIGNYTRGSASYRLDADDATPERIETAHRLFGAYLALVRARRLVDKYPELLFRIPFVRAIFPDALFVLSVRDGWDTVGSVTAWSRRLGRREAGETHDWWGVDDRKWDLLVRQVAARHPVLKPRVNQLLDLDDHAGRAALEWTLTMWEGRRQADLLGPAASIVRFEDFSQSPGPTVERLLTGLDLEPDPNVLTYAARAVAAPSRRDPVRLPEEVEDAFVSELEAMGYRR